MLSVNDLQEMFAAHCATQQLPANPINLYQPITHIMGIGGKRIRPLLCLVACQIFSPKVEEALAPALSIEFFHNFTLMHDDIMDNAPLRRGHETVHAKYGLNAAILSGDAMLIKAYEYLCQSPKQHLPALLSLFNQTSLEICEGQQYDMDFEQQPQVSIPQYLRMIELKTAVLIAAALKMGAIVGGAKTPDTLRIYEFGRNIGIAFQLQDDLLDTFGLPEKFGKQLGGDILQNKKTFLLLKALETAQGEQLARLKTWLNAKQYKPEEKVQEVTAIYRQLGVETAAHDTMQEHYNIAFEYLNSISVNNNCTQLLRNITEQLMNREW